MGRIAGLSLGAALCWGGALHAETAFDLVFRSGTLDGLPLGTELRYDVGDAPEDAEGEVWREIVVGLESGDRALVSRRAEGDDPPQVVGSFPAGVGNPVAMVLLERTVNRIAEETGGSPYYIRNRIRDALGSPAEAEAVTVPWEGGTVPATEVALAPFAEDAHRAELGAFADLEIRVVVSEAVPGWYVSISAQTPAEGEEPGYAESFALAGVGP